MEIIDNSKSTSKKRCAEYLHGNVRPIGEKRRPLVDISTLAQWTAPPSRGGLTLVSMFDFSHAITGGASGEHGMELIAPFVMCRFTMGLSKLPDAGKPNRIITFQLYGLWPPSEPYVCLLTIAGEWDHIIESTDHLCEITPAMVQLQHERLANEAAIAGEYQRITSRGVLARLDQQITRRITGPEVAA